MVVVFFLSNYKNKVDKKGRVSVPSQFRAILRNEEFDGIIVYKSFINDCLEGCSWSKMKKLSESIDNLDDFSPERDILATAILGSSHQLIFDKEGRVILPKDLSSGVGISEQATFVGKGDKFEIWDTVKFNKHLGEVHKLAKENILKLKFSNQQNNPSNPSNPS
ncbi:division/cell wall cluster transcriptional repressor MraZ [Rickettsiales bacterium]|nr:division/cell wall cluster transcriptional repressor MraZ [Rickettsiales bacterium]